MFNRRRIKTPRIPKKVMSACAQAFMLAQADPWSAERLQPCVPDFITTVSQKRFFRRRFTVTTNALGFAYVALNPYSMYNSDFVTPSASQRPIAYSGAAYATVGGDGVNTILTTTGTTGVTSLGWNNTYGALSEERMARPVAGGIKVTDTGAQDARAGTYTLFAQPMNYAEMFDAAVTQAQLLAYDETIITPIRAEPVAVLFHLKNSVDYTYRNTATTSSAISNGHLLCIRIDGAGATARTFEVDVCMHYEIIDNTGQGATPSESDLGAFAWINTALGSFQSKHDPHSNQGKVIAAAKAAGWWVGMNALNSVLQGASGGALPMLTF